jgi:hypothetical protein
MAHTMRHALSTVAANSRRANSPLPLLIVGLALILFWVWPACCKSRPVKRFCCAGLP